MPGMLTHRHEQAPDHHRQAQEGRRARAGAPWIFSNEIRMDAAAKALAPGALVNVQGR